MDCQICTAPIGKGTHGSCVETLSNLLTSALLRERRSTEAAELLAATIERKEAADVIVTEALGRAVEDFERLGMPHSAARIRRACHRAIRELCKGAQNSESCGNEKRSYLDRESEENAQIKPT